MRKKRLNYSPQEKVAILKRHLVDRVAVSDVCDEYVTTGGCCITRNILAC